MRIEEFEIKEKLDILAVAKDGVIERWQII